MFTVTKTFTFCYGHRLLRDPGKCHHLHGHTVRTSVTVAAENLDDRGMVCHFDDLNEKLGTWIKETLDHRTILMRNDPLAEALTAAGEDIVLLDVNPTAEHLAKLVFDHAVSLGFNVHEVELWESPTSKAVYRKS